MSGLYLSKDERAALASIDGDGLRELIDEAIACARPGSLHGIGLTRCGPYVAERLRRFERDLDYYCKARSAQKRSDTRAQAHRAGSELAWAVRDMQNRMADEDKELARSRIDDIIPSPRTFRERLELRVGFSWRDADQDEWHHGSIVFGHQVDMQPDHSRPPPTRKPSAARQEEERQDELYRRWEHLRTLALNAVREFFQQGGDGAAIPAAFETRTGPQSRYLDNFSCDFWRDRAPPSAPAA